MENTDIESKVYVAYHSVRETIPPEHRTKEFIQYRKDWEYYSLHFDVIRDFPMHIDIEITTHCNLLCPMCERTLMIENGYPWENSYMDFATFKKIIDEATANGAYAANVSMVGEPMMHKDLPRMIGYAKNARLLDVMINTNATLLNEKIAEAIIDAGLDRLIISFDGIRPQTYERIRKNAKFDVVVENIKRFMDIRRKKNKNLPLVKLYMTVMKENRDEVDEFCKFWKDAVDCVALNDYQNPLGLDKKDRYNKEPKEIKEKFICHMLWQRLSVKVDGTILPCCDDFGKNLALGNIHSATLKECWNSQRLKAFRKLHLEGRAKDIAGCNKCDWVYYEY